MTDAIANQTERRQRARTRRGPSWWFVTTVQAAVVTSWVAAIWYALS